MNKLLLALLVASTMLASCDHKNMMLKPSSPYHLDLQTRYELNWQYTYDGTDWRNSWPTDFGISYESLEPQEPTGLRVLTYNEDGTSNFSNLEANGGELYISPGHHSMLMYNNNTEYIVFEGLEQYATATATTRSRSRTSYLGNPFSSSGSRNENTVNPPDVLFGHYIDEYEFDKRLDGTSMQVTMHPLVFTYLVRYEFSSGLQYVALARGALSGMAASVHLNNGTTSKEVATVLFDCTMEPFGAQAEVRSFGIPDFPNENYNRGAGSFALNLEVRLYNGKMLSFDFDVSDQVEAQPHGGVIVVRDIVIPDEAGASGGSGFDVGLTGWGEYQDVQLQL